MAAGNRFSRDRTVGDRVQSKESVRLTLPGDLGPECLQEEWDVDIQPQESQVLAFWDTFEWGLWFGGHILYSSGGAYHLCAREGGWLGTELCGERGGTRRRFWSDFETGAMRARLEGMREAGRKTAQKRFCASLVVPQYVKYYERVLGSRD